jgi:pilus assembly protein Flp/PilA
MTTEPPARARHVRHDSGQGVTEYIIIVVLVAIAAIGVVTIFGDNIRDLFAGATRATSGEVREGGAGKARSGAAKAGEGPANAKGKGKAPGS